MAVTNKTIKQGSVSISFSVGAFPATFPATADVSYTITDIDDDAYNKHGYLRHTITTGSLSVDAVAMAISGAICTQEGI